MSEQKTPDGPDHHPVEVALRQLAPLRRALLLTRAGMVAERLWRSFWPLATVLLLAAGLVLLGIFDWVVLEVAWGGAVLVVLGAVAATVWGVMRFRWPKPHEAVARLDETLPGRPIAAILDHQVSGAEDAASVALWQAHQARMAARAAEAEAPAPNLRIADRDPYALRYVALLVLVTGLLFGTAWRAGSVAELMPGGGNAGLNGPTWEGWVEPPRYTGLPTLYLGDLTEDTLRIPQNSRVTLRFYGDVGDLTLAETVSGRTGELPSASAPEQNFTVTEAGDLTIDGTGGRSWRVEVIRDAPPLVSLAGEPDLSADGTLTLPFNASDDYGVVGGTVTISLDEASLNRRYGLATAPDARDPITLPLPLSLTGDRRLFSEVLEEEFSAHPWANLPVIYSLRAEDAAGQQSVAATLHGPLTARRFFDPMAAALVEQRRDLLWARANGPRVARILRTLSHRPEELFSDMGNYLQLRTILKRLERYSAHGLSPVHQDEIASALWALALQLEEGDVGDALERMRQAQERLSQAMRDGASDEEIARLMQELREATDDYMRQLSRQAQQQDGDQEGGESSDNAIQLSQQDLQAMMDRIQELMEQGRMAEAEQALREFQQMMENMQVTQGQPGQGDSPGQQAMDGLADTLREQQGLSDQAFRDLQEQFNPNAQRGESQGNEGRDGGLGRGQSHQGGGAGGQDDGPQGEGGQNEGREAEGGQSPSGGQGNGAGDLAQRQQALRDELQRQRDGLPLGGPEGEAARDSLDQAGRAMEGAEEALREGDYAEAIDRQSEAMEALRDGMRALGEAMAEQQQQGQQPGGQQGQSTRQGNALDPLGRDRGGQGSDFFSRDSIGEGQAYRRAWDLLEEIRRRAGERERSESERNYLQRLLDRF
ncbi:TIGR02302 family protein [Tritonibacter mobilis]|nr:TIGR02302 family protein [Tritonibacter mobilis]